MGVLAYLGVGPATSRGLEIKAMTDTVIDSGLSQGYVDGRVTDMISGAVPLYTAKATRTYVDTQDVLYSTPAYYTAHDALLIPTASRGAVGGVASLNSSGLIPTGQLPSAGGEGIFKGPYGMNKQYTASTGSIPVKVGEWVYPLSSGSNFGAVSCTCQLMVFGFGSAMSVGGRPVLEVRAGTSTQTDYVNQKRIALGYGRTVFNDYQQITILPSWAGVSNPAWTAGTVITATMWMYDDAGGTTSTVSGSIGSAALYLARTAL